MGTTNIALSAIDNTTTHTDNAPSVMNVIAVKTKNIQIIGSSFIGVEKPEGEKQKPR